MCSILKIEGASILAAIWWAMCTEEYSECLSKVFILIETDSFPYVGLEDKHKRKGPHNLKASEGPSPVWLSG